MCLKAQLDAKVGRESHSRSQSLHIVGVQVKATKPSKVQGLENLRTLGGTPHRDPCSLWGLIWGLPRDIGVI